VAEPGDVKLVQYLFDPLAHDGWRQAQILHPEGQLILDHVGYELGLGILEHEADEVTHATRAQIGRVAPGDLHPACQSAAGKMRHQAVKTAQQRRLATARRTDHQHELTFGDVQTDVIQHRLRAIWIVV